MIVLYPVTVLIKRTVTDSYGRSDGIETLLNCPTSLRLFLTGGAISVNGCGLMLPLVHRNGAPG